MPEFIELFKKIDANNIPFLIALCAGIIIVFAGCIRPFFASPKEILFMNKKDELKRLSLSYIIMFIMFGAINYLFISYVQFIAMWLIVTILISVLYFILWIINKFGKMKPVFLRYKERFRIMFIVIFFPIIAYACSMKTGIKIMGCAVIIALIETIIAPIIYLNPTPRDSTVFVKIDSMKWYVLRKLDDEHFLCGDRNNIEKCKEIRILELATIMQSNIIFEIENV